MTAKDPKWLDSLSEAEVAVLANAPDFWRPGQTPAEINARNALVEALEALARCEPDVATAAIERARQCLAAQALLAKAAGS